MAPLPAGGAIHRWTHRRWCGGTKPTASVAWGTHAQCTLGAAATRLVPGALAAVGGALQQLRAGTAVTAIAANGVLSVGTAVAGAAGAGAAGGAVASGAAAVPAAPWQDIS